MSGSGHQCEKLDSSDGAHVVQLRRLVWLLLVWSFFMTMGLAVCISLQFALSGRNSNNTVPVNHPELIMYDYDESAGADGSIELKWQNNRQRNVTVEVPKDGNYFLYLQVTLEYLMPNMTYTVKVDKLRNINKRDKILEGHINGSQLSTGLMGKGFSLSKGTILKVTCNATVKLNSRKTYLGIMILS